ncbi:MAG: hypothetical protein ACRDBH_08635 [Bosea sp. (in: a-proteobacteria)]
MKVFDDLTREQSTLYRWLLENLSSAEVLSLTGVDTAGARPEHVDHALREAYHFDRLRSSEVIADVQLRAGILPTDIGQALAEYGSVCALRALSLIPDAGMDSAEAELRQIAALRKLTDVLLRRLK